MPEWIELYHINSLDAIAKKYNTSKYKVKQYLLSQDIVLRRRGGMNNPNMLLQNNALKRRKTYKDAIKLASDIAAEYKIMLGE